MHYLKCNKCGHFNEVKSEYLIFCSNCNKKLENNYSDWSKRNSDKTFNDFKNSICTTEILQAPQVKTRSINPKKYKTGIIIGLVIAFLIILGQFGGPKLVELLKKSVFNKEVMLLANEVNKSCPIMVDKETRLDNAVPLPDNVLQYNYTLVNMVKDSINIDKLKDYLEPVILNTVKTNPQMQSIRDAKITLNYYYKDKTGAFLLIITIKPEQYQ